MDTIREKILLSFKDLTFNELDHSYFIKNKKLNNSVSGLIKNFTVPFDAETMSRYVAIKENKTQEEILNSWKTKADFACDKGSKIHYFAECYTFTKSLKSSNGYEESVINFFNSLPEHIIPTLVEVKMYHKGKFFAGTMDTLFYNTLTKKFIVTDYKTNENLFKNYRGKKLLGPFSELLDNAFNKYQIQLSYYQILFEQTGFEVEQRYIIHLKDNGVFDMYECTDYTKELKIEINKY